METEEFSEAHGSASLEHEEDPASNKVGGEDQLWRLFSDLHMLTPAFTYKNVYTYVCTHTEK